MACDDHLTLDPRDLPVVVDALRTPIGTAGHGLRDVDAADLAAPVLAALAARALAVDEVVLGNCMGPGGDVARVAALSAGLPLAVPALTVDRQCGSGLAAVTVGAALVRDGASVVVAGGVESASTAPWRSWPSSSRDGEPVRYARAPFGVRAGPSATPTWGSRQTRRRARRRPTAAGRLRGTPARRAAATLERGGFAEETVPVGAVHVDERPRAGLTAERLGRLRPSTEPTARSPPQLLRR